MATTRIIPLHAGKGRTVGKAIRSLIDYVKNPISTIAGLLGLAVCLPGKVQDLRYAIQDAVYG